MSSLQDQVIDVELAKSHLLKTAFGPATEKVEAIRKELAKTTFEAKKGLVEAQSKVFEQRKEIIKDIKQFWPKTLGNSNLGQGFEKEDEAALSHLEDLSVSFSSSDPREYTITFTFSSNPFFSDTTLVKKFKVLPEAKTSSPYELDVPTISESTSISWKDEQHNLEKKYPKPDVEQLEEFDPVESFGSFFNFFGEEDVGEIGTELVQIYENAFDFFSGIADLDAGEDTDFDSDDEEDEDDGAEEVDLGDSESDMPNKKKQKKN